MKFVDIYFLGDEIVWQFPIKIIQEHFIGWNQNVVYCINESVCLIWGYTTAMPLLILLYLINHIKVYIHTKNKKMNPNIGLP